MTMDDRFSSPPSPSFQSTCRVTLVDSSLLNTNVSVQPRPVVFQCFMNKAYGKRVSTILNCTRNFAGTLPKLVCMAESKPSPVTCSVLPSEMILNRLPALGGGV